MLTVDQQPDSRNPSLQLCGGGSVPVAVIRRNYSGRPGNETLETDSTRSFSGYGWRRFEAICEVNGDIDLTEEEERPQF